MRRGIALLLFLLPACVHAPPSTPDQAVAVPKYSKPVLPLLSFRLPDGFEQEEGATFFRSTDPKNPVVTIACRDAAGLDMESECLQEDALVRELEGTSRQWTGTIGPWKARGLESTFSNGKHSFFAVAFKDDGELVELRVEEMDPDVIASNIRLPDRDPPQTPEGYTRHRARCGGTRASMLDIDVPKDLVVQNAFRIARMDREYGFDVRMQISLTSDRTYATWQLPAVCEPQPRHRMIVKPPAITLAGTSASVTLCHDMNDVLVARSTLADGRILELRAASFRGTDVESIATEWAETIIVIR